jgi:hypothetical protein
VICASCAPARSVRGSRRAGYFSIFFLLLAFGSAPVCWFSPAVFFTAADDDARPVPRFGGRLHGTPTPATIRPCLRPSPAAHAPRRDGVGGRARAGTGAPRRGDPGGRTADVPCPAVPRRARRRPWVGGSSRGNGTIPNSSTRVSLSSRLSAQVASSCS